MTLICSDLEQNGLCRSLNVGKGRASSAACAARSSLAAVKLGRKKGQLSPSTPQVVTWMGDARSSVVKTSSITLPAASHRSGSGQGTLALVTCMQAC